MNPVIRALNRHTPDFIIQMQLRMLMQATAHAFDCTPTNIKGLPWEEALRKYAIFTQEQAALALQSGRNTDALSDRLYAEAYSLGRRLRRLLHLSAGADMQALIIRLYRNIGITMDMTMEGNIPDKICVKSCYFSSFYSGEVCKLISALDNGIMSGLHEGGTLTFHKRLTEGSTCCVACFRKNGGTE